MQKVYLDNAATTKVMPAVVEAMLPYFTEYYGNCGNKGGEYITETDAYCIEQR